MILNGRTPGDEEGNYTYIGKRGASVLDYCIISEYTWQKVISLKVDETRIDSDHLPLILTLQEKGKDKKGELEIVDVLSTEMEETAIRNWGKEIKDKIIKNMDNNWKHMEEQFSHLSNTEEKLILLNRMWMNTLRITGLMRKSKQEPSFRGADWFDNECLQAKKETRRLLRRFRKQKTDASREEYIAHKKDLRKLYKEKQRKKKNEQIQEILQSNSGPEFWKLIRKFRKKRNNYQKHISLENWERHFKNKDNAQDMNIQENNSSVEKQYIQNLTTEEAIIEELDGKIQLLEIVKVIKDLRDNKAAGPDGEFNELYKLMSGKQLEEFQNIINDIWTKEKIPKTWREADIVPIYKNGNIQEPENYRGISLLNTAYKIFSGVLNNRLQTWMEDGKKIEESQGGFRKAHGPVDQVFTLHTLIENRLKEKKHKLYAFFIDFKTAFDRIDRKIMLRKLHKMGVQGKLYRMIREIYSTTTNRVKIGKERTRSFTQHSGVRQGCALSPTLFSIYLNDLEEEIRDKKIGGTTLGDKTYYCLKYADDVVFLAETSDDLQAMIHTLERYTEVNKLELNTDKSKIIIFRRGGRYAKNEIWWWKEQKIEIVNKYKYLGIWLTTAHTYEEQHKQQRAKAQRIINMTNVLLKEAHITHFKSKCILFDTLIASVLTYGAEIWGTQTIQKIEKIQGQYFKRAMQLANNTPAYIWQMELGRKDMLVKTTKRAYNYILKILQMESTRYPRQCFKYCLSIEGWRTNSWIYNLQKMLHNTGFSYLIDKLREAEDEHPIREKMEKSLEILVQQNMQRNWNKIDRSTFCNYYKMIKYDGGVPNYLNNRNTEDVKIWINLRCGGLLRGKKRGYSMNYQSCRKCKNETETLEHVVNCTQMREEQETFLHNIRTDHMTQIYKILKEEEIHQKILTYIKRFLAIE